MKKTNLWLTAPLLFLTLQLTAQSKKPSFSGIYPHLAMYNSAGECGTGAVVPWAGKLWAITYAPHLPFGSDDKLYEISADLTQTVRPESIGGTPANRMIHKESNQLFIGPYAIDAKGGVRAISYKTMPGRHTGNARHLTDPKGKIYYGTMEEGFYEVDVKSLDVKTLYTDGNVKNLKSDGEQQPYQYNNLLPGAHGKGYYSGQGVTVYSNNGEPGKKAEQQFDVESGSLSEWDGKNWKVVRRNQFVEVTGPGGIDGNKNPETDAIWATGWDHKSLLMAVRDHGKWTFYRLPKASHAYDGAHGWNTEWPRIRDVGTAAKPDYLMTMHGMFWKFPETFTSKNSAGIRPKTAYLKVIGDYTRWNDQLVFGCDDSAQREFLNKRKAKGNIEGPGQSNSNLWFTSLTKPDELGPNNSEGAVWLNENVKANAASEPFLFSGWARRTAWVQNNGDSEVAFTFEVDKSGNDSWAALKTVKIPAKTAREIVFATAESGEWIRIKADKETYVSAHFSYQNDDKRTMSANAIFNGLSPVNAAATTGGLLYGLGENRRALGITALNYAGSKASDAGYYELDGDMKLSRKEDLKTKDFIKTKFRIPQQVVTIDASSVLVIDDKGRRWRLPLGDEAFTGLTNDAALRICREVSTERDLFNCHGTFYELPAENADGYAKIRPISSHKLRINDYASYRGLLVMTGIDAKSAKGNEHIIVSDDQKAAVWAGAIDDLWKLGKPTGHGGPLNDTQVKANEASDPFLIGFYDQKTLQLSHNAKSPVTFTMEVDPVGNGPWMESRKFVVEPGKTVDFSFPKEFAARWVRFKADKDCEATAWMEYR
ncbi:hypothetical protein [Dyadobacter fermentans]|uniref:Uncharacterized protein n=1 Tax=Dyadobacter fermentans (strain ATCC 700827 / DSM 18053 / CIP 107007 / KCTC 52180 / NS114) TaxID=471854 RepID=C6VUU8_DYAFD|nr:hypothetical protein [Dyadobacter fermentans]ACT93085.1 hypothetical protein Dfer_1848 [Dyadobacter fermentans DSM 18053]